MEQTFTLAQVGIATIIAFVVGFVSCALITKWITAELIRHKFYTVDSTTSIKNAIIILVALVWFFAVVTGILTRTPIDINIHIIMTTALGAYWGVDIFTKKGNKK